MKGHIIVIDEAHNLMDAIANIHSISVSLRQFQRARTQLAIYLQKFRNRLKGKNRVYVTQTVRLLDSMIAFLQSKIDNTQQTEDVVNVGDLMAGKGVDQINLHKLMRYLQESKLARKVEGYVSQCEQEGVSRAGSVNTSKLGKQRSAGPKQDATVPVLTHIQGFLLSLTNPSAEGRIFYMTNEDADASLRYMLLDPTHHFREIVEEARAIVLAGGTMSPVSFARVMR